MAIFRGSGGSGDATTDASSEGTLASTKASEAATSASEAAASATNAATSESNAATSETNASTSASTAGGHATNASTSETNAATSASNASTSETNASTSATTATTKASEASTSATNAATSATSASTSATTATTKASEAATSATNALTSETNAAASYDSFDDRYLGAKSSAPTVDNDGDALLTGALYWNSTSNSLFLWDGSAWNIAAFDTSGTVTSFNTRTGVVTLSSGDVTTALGFTPIASFTETNDLSSAVTWANVPDANITQSSVTQHEAALSITESQISDLAHTTTLPYASITGTPTIPTNNNELTNGAGYITDYTVTEADVTAHEAALSITESQVSDLGTYVEKTSNTGAAEMPSGTTAERDVSPSAGYLRFNSTTTGFEGYDGSAWGSIGGGGGASAGGAIYENTDDITSDYTITTGSNGFSVGPMTIASGVSVTVPSGQRWVIL